MVEPPANLFDTMPFSAISGASMIMLFKVIFVVSNILVIRSGIEAFEIVGNTILLISK